MKLWLSSVKANVLIRGELELRVGEQRRVWLKNTYFAIYYHRNMLVWIYFFISSASFKSKASFLFDTVMHLKARRSDS